MRKHFIFILLMFPFLVFGQTHVGPEGDRLLIGVLFLVVCAAIWWFFRNIRKRSVVKPKSKSFWGRRKKVELVLSKDRLVRPKVLTLVVRNTGNCVVDLDAPVLVFRKLWSMRKFKLKRYKNQEIYPLYLEAGKSFTLQIELVKFFEHDRKLKRFYWGRILMYDVTGRKFKSKHVSLRKSLYT